MTERMDMGIVGSGGREFEIGRQVGLDDEVRRVYFLNGNAGTATLDKGENVPIGATAIDDIVSFADEKQLDLTIIGPEAPLVAGVTDRLRQKGLTVFGPSAEAAQLEGSKAYAAQFMAEHAIPHPPTVVAESYGQALEFIGGQDPTSYVIKADGLAGGKGVVLPDSQEEARQVLQAMFLKGGYDGAGKERVLLSRRFHGPELSALAVSDGHKFVRLPFSQDHKRLLNNDEGPNTGGMGAYAPLPAELVDASQEQKIDEIIERTIGGMARRGVPYRGLLYIGIMLAEELGGDPAVIEYNVRFGDPETQVVLPLLERAGVDVPGLLRSSAEGYLDTVTIPRNLGSSALTVCLAAEGYPSNPQKGQPIHGLNNAYLGVIIHHAATKLTGGQIETSGGRALYVTGIGQSIDAAAEAAYRAIGHGPDHVGFPGMQYRDDIGHQVRSTKEVIDVS